jgi:hypothetical protein
MATPHPLALTSEQLALIRSAADTVPANFRERFLLAVQDALLGRDPIINADVVAAVGRLRRTMLLGSGTPTLSPDD